MTEPTLIYGSQEVARALANLSANIIARHPETPTLLGVRRGGATMATRLAALMTASLGAAPPTGVLDINLYRDDWTRARAMPKVGRTEIRHSLDHRRVVVVDDVLYTGRTVRAALEELSNFGRPDRVELAVLVDRGQREMPIQPDYVSFVVAAQPDEVVEVCFAGEGGEDRILLLKKVDLSSIGR
ncbi:MAG: bifunctional pyr operon transcriptional regulator/uracil phosphoribosyltransferase PyrR [Deltaproteobacteria bacterium]|jgi:pyrimidine operon attenuation protein/uracil phosphoribosyltransferase|nr:bifunctional pyr operon transcriptional regulator/uracil phosphoribosyltransferase PyrR [Deltaproteobacteria bacterium]